MDFVSEKKERLDSAVAGFLGVARSQVIELIKGGFVITKKPAKPGLFLNPGDKITINLPPKNEQKSAATAADSELFEMIEILYEDDDILVINKPSGLTTHGAPSVKEPTLCDWLAQSGRTLSTLGARERPGIVHRLDKGTSGVMVIAKTNAAHTHLSSQLNSRQMGRIYLAITDLALKDNIIIERPIIRHPTNRLKYTVLKNGDFSHYSAPQGLKNSDFIANLAESDSAKNDFIKNDFDKNDFDKNAAAQSGPNLPQGARYAKSAFANVFIGDGEGEAAQNSQNPQNPQTSRLQTSPNAPKINLIAAKLFTGRTHQIRVHLASLNRFILNDELYSPKNAPKARILEAAAVVSGDNGGDNGGVILNNAKEQAGQNSAAFNATNAFDAAKMANSSQIKQNSANITRFFLHAYLLHLIHPKTSQPLQITAPLPPYFTALLSQKYPQKAIYEATLPQNINAIFSDFSSWMRG